MKIIVRFVLIFAPVMATVVFLSLKVTETQQREWVMTDLSRRANLIFESTNDYIAEGITNKNFSAVRKLLNRISRDERLTGAMVCDPAGKVIVKSDAVPPEVDCFLPPNANEGSTLLSLGGVVLHKAVFSIAGENGKIGSLVVLHDSSYMFRRHKKTEEYLVILLSAMAVFFFLMSLFIYRWSTSATVEKMKSIFAELVGTDSKEPGKSWFKEDLSPLAKDLKKVLVGLRNSKVTEAESAGGLATWTSAKLRAELQKSFGDSQLCVIANREPYIHVRKGNKVEVLFPASGLVTAVEPIVRACSGLWIAHGSGNADREFVDSQGKLLVPPDKPEYVLKRVWLSKSEEQGYYYGFSNEGLWPLCHIAHARPTFRTSDWETYKNVNSKFARAFLSENPGDRPVVLIQDYHFALLPELIRRERSDAVINLFWHIPWPNPEAFGICPWKKELLQGMLGADVLGFHTQFHCNNFLDTVDRYLEARVDRENFSVTIQGHVCYVKPFPISIEWPFRYDLPQEKFTEERAELLQELNLPPDIKVGIGVDRVDYTKGILERLRAVERLFEMHTELLGKFTFIQIGAPSRTHIKAYQNLNAEVQELADQINWKFHGADVPPIILKLSHHNAPELARYYRTSDLCFVSSLHDGMNLVAKEYIAAHSDLRGVLVLSSFTGAAKELADGLIVNPYDVEESARALFDALKMSEGEQQRRMSALRKIVSENNVYTWASSLLSEVSRIASRKNQVLEKHVASK